MSKSKEILITFCGWSDLHVIIIGYLVGRQQNGMLWDKQHDNGTEEAGTGRGGHSVRQMFEMIDYSQHWLRHLQFRFETTFSQLPELTNRLGRIPTQPNFENEILTGQSFGMKSSKFEHTHSPNSINY